MTADEYVYTLDVNGIEVKVGIDDYGQCFFYEYTDCNGNLKVESCGAFNEGFVQYIYHELDPSYKELARKALYDELDEYDEDKLEDYHILFKEAYKKYYEKIC